MKVAVLVSELSYCERKKVGAVLVNNDIITFGYNGTPSGWDNCCEERVEQYAENDIHAEILMDQGFEYDHEKEAFFKLVTKEEVLHAESNSMAKIAKTTLSSENSVLFITLMPCIECAKLIRQEGIKEVYYLEDYRCDKGRNFLVKSGISITKVEL